MTSFPLPSTCHECLREQGQERKVDERRREQVKDRKAGKMRIKMAGEENEKSDDERESEREREVIKMESVSCWSVFIDFLHWSAP